MLILNSLMMFDIPLTYKMYSFEKSREQLNASTVLLTNNVGALFLLISLQAMYDYKTSLSFRLDKYICMNDRYLFQCYIFR